VRSIANAVGEYWQLSEIEWYESKDGSGNPVGADQFDKRTSSTYKDSPKPGQPDTSEHRPEKAMDGDTATFWSSSSDIKFEYIAVKFKTPKDIRSIKMQLASENMGPPMVIVEKSSDGENWARSTEISDMKKWGSKLDMYGLVDMDAVPTVSTFALRSQENPRFCVGVRETPAEDPEDPALPLEEGAVLEMQPCSDARTTQYWQIRKDFLLANAKDSDMVVNVDALQNGATLSMKKYQCDTDEETGEELCPSWGANSKFNFAEEAKGGLMFSKTDNNGNLVMQTENLEEGVQVKYGECGSDGEQPSDVANCASITGARWELKPMFLVEPKRMAIGCAPYTHMNIKPLEALDERAAMTECAAKADCLAYNWAEDGAVCPTTPPCEGKYTLHSWSCTALHEVHSGQMGWSLGVRCGKLEPFVEERTKKLDL
jgi:hypothetical protein